MHFAKRGCNIFDNKTFRDPVELQSLPLLTEKGLKTELQHFLELDFAYHTIDKPSQNEGKHRKKLV